MKGKLLLAIIIIFISSAAAGQSMYVITKSGKMVDSTTYTKMKEEQVDKMKKMFPGDGMEVSINEDLTEERRTKDSIVYSYKWDIKIGNPKSGKSGAVRMPDYSAYTGKEFAMPVLQTIDGKPVDMEALKGKPTLVNFWFTTCAPCIDEMPVLNKIREQLKDSVHFIAITFEPAAMVKTFLTKHPFDFVQLANAKAFIDSLGISTYPMNFFIDKEGVVRRVSAGIPYVMRDGNMEMGDGQQFIRVLRSLL